MMANPNKVNIDSYFTILGSLMANLQNITKKFFLNLLFLMDQDCLSVSF